MPRFYGLDVDAVFGATVTDDELRLAIARTYGAPSWQVLMQRNVEDSPPRNGLNERPCGHPRMSVAEVESLIATAGRPLARVGST
ncbi:MAG: hypothetical protein ACKVS7_06980 [Gemmatimonadaceae bacterium]